MFIGTTYALGFSEPQNFSRFFRAQTDMSPEEFRELLERQAAGVVSEAEPDASLP